MFKFNDSKLPRFNATPVSNQATNLSQNSIHFQHFSKKNYGQLVSGKANSVNKEDTGISRRKEGHEENGRVCPEREIQIFVHEETSGGIKCTQGPQSVS